MSTKKYQEDLRRLVGLDKASRELDPQDKKDAIECNRGIGTMDGSSSGGDRNDTTVLPDPNAEDDAKNGDDGTGDESVDDPTGGSGGGFSPECSGGRIKDYWSGCKCPDGKTWNGTLCIDRIEDIFPTNPDGSSSGSPTGTAPSSTQYGVNGVGGLFDCVTGDAVEIFFETPTQPVEAGGTEASTEENSTIPLPVHKCNCATECVSYDPDDSYVAGTYASFGETVGLYPAGFSYGYSINNLPAPIVDWGTPTAPYLGYYYTYEYPYIQDTPNPDGFITIYSYRRKYNATNDQLDSEGPVGIGALNGCNYIANPDYCNGPYQGICVEGEVCDEYPWKAYDCYQPAEGCGDDPDYTEGSGWSLGGFGCSIAEAVPSQIPQSYLNCADTNPTFASQPYRFHYKTLSGKYYIRIATSLSYNPTSPDSISEVLINHSGQPEIAVGYLPAGGYSLRTENSFLTNFSCAILGNLYPYQQDYCTGGQPETAPQVCDVEEQCCPPRCLEDEGYVAGKYWEASPSASQFTAQQGQVKSEAMAGLVGLRYEYSEFVYGIITREEGGTIYADHFWVADDTSAGIDVNAGGLTQLDCGASTEPYCTDTPDPVDNNNCHWQADGTQQYTWTKDGLVASDLDPDAKNTATEAEEPVFCDSNNRKVKPIKGKDGGTILSYNFDDPDVTKQYYAWRDPNTGRLSFFDNTQLVNYQATGN